MNLVARSHEPGAEARVAGAGSSVLPVSSDCAHPHSSSSCIPTPGLLQPFQKREPCLCFFKGMVTRAQGSARHPCQPSPGAPPTPSTPSGDGQGGGQLTAPRPDPRSLTAHAGQAASPKSRPPRTCEHGLTREQALGRCGQGCSGMRSFMRLMVFKNVDFPHPDGPMNAVI